MLRRRLEQRPVLASSKMAPYLFVLIVSGNTLDSGQSGVVYVESPGVDEVPSAYDPNVTSTFIDGIGRGTLYINGVSTDGYVLVVNDSRGVNQFAVLAGESVFVYRTVEIPVDGGGTVTAYVIS